MVNDKEDLLSFKEQNSIKLQELVSKSANFWRKYKRTKTEDDKVKIYEEIEELQPQIKELYDNKRCCDTIYKRAIKIQNNLDYFDRDIDITKEKDKIRHHFFDILLLISILNI